MSFNVIKFQQILPIIFMGTNHRKVSADSFSLNIQSNASKIKGAFSRLMAQCDNTEKEVLLSFSFTELYSYGNKMPTLKCSLFFFFCFSYIF